MKKCKKHPKYKAISCPKIKCDICEHIWLNSENGIDWQTFFDEFKRGNIWEETDFLQEMYDNTKDKKLKLLIDKILKAYESLLEKEGEAYYSCQQNLFLDEK